MYEICIKFFKRDYDIRSEFLSFTPDRNNKERIII